MKILLLNASPRKGGNTEVLCEQFAKGARKAGHTVVKTDIREKRIAPCQACDYCKQSHACIQKDDMAEILEEMKKADVMVLAAPVYFYAIPAQLKLVIDRTYAGFTELKDKQFYYIVTAADPRHEAAENTIEAFRGFTGCLPDAVEKGILYGTGTWDKGDIHNHPAFQQAYEMGKGV